MKTKTALSFGIVALFLAGGFYFFTGQNTTQEGAFHKKNDRWISSLDVNEQKLITKINSNIIGLRSKENVIPLLDELKTSAEKNPNMQVVQLYNLVLSPLRHFKGFMWRTRGFVEKSCGPCHLMAIKAISKLYHSDYLYGPHIKAVIDFVVEPTPDYEKFDKISDVQDFMSSSIIPSLEASLKKIDTVIGATSPGVMFELDTKVIAGFDETAGLTYVSEKSINKKVVQGNLYYIKAGLQRALGLMYYSINYNFNDVPTFIDRMVKNTALNSIFTPRYSTTLDYVNMAPRFPNVGKARTSMLKDDKKVVITKKDIQSNLDTSFDYIKNEAQSRVDALEKSKDQSTLAETSRYLINPEILKLNYDDTIRNLGKRRDMFVKAASNEATIFNSDVTGVEITINPKALFTYQADLKDFLPENLTAEGNTVRKIGRGDDFKWNYNYGKVNKWKKVKFGGLLPSATNVNITEIVRTLKTTPYTSDIANLLPGF